MTAPRLLLVDDDPDLGVIVRVLARRGGFVLDHRADAEAAWAALHAEPFDLVLLDVNLPGASGIDLLRRLRSAPEFAAQPVALFCQPTLMRDIGAGWEAGADYLVSKELVTQPDLWKRRLDEILGRPHGREAAASLLLSQVDIVGDLASLDRVRALPPFQGISPALLDPMTRRACRASFGPEEAVATDARPQGQGATRGQRHPPATPDQVRRFLESLFDQVGRLFGQAACEKMLAEIRADRQGR